MATPELPLSDDDWTLIEETDQTVFDVPLVSVTNRTRVYENTELRDTLSAVTGTDTTWRFVFGTAINLKPAVGHSGPLTRLVRRQAFDAFPDQLRDRGFKHIERVERYSEARDDGRKVYLRRYAAVCELEDGEQVETGAIAGVWTAADGVFGFAGGAYPTTLPSDTSPSPTAFEQETYDIIMGTTID